MKEVIRILIVRSDRKPIEGASDGPMPIEASWNTNILQWLPWICKEVIRALIVRSNGGPIEDGKIANDGVISVEDPWHTNILPELFEIYFGQVLERHHEITFANDEKEALMFLSADLSYVPYDFAVFASEHQAELLELLSSQKLSTIPMIVHDSESKTMIEESHWVNNVLTLFDWTSHNDLEPLLDKGMEKISSRTAL